MKKYIDISILIILIFIFLTTLVYSQQNISTLKSLTKNSEVILIGKVSKQESKWNENQSHIYTDVTIEVDEYLKGQIGEKYITVSHLGGEIDEVGELYTHTASFKEAEEMVLFVKRDKNDGKYRVYSSENGKIEIIKNKSSKQRFTASNKKVDDLKKEIQSYLAE